MPPEGQHQNTDNPTVGLTEAAEELGVHPSTVRRYIREGQIPAHKAEGSHGPEWRIYSDDLQAFAQGDQELHKVLNESDSGQLGELLDRFAHLEQTLGTGLEEIIEAQKALRPSEEELRARVEREKCIEEALSGNTARIEELAREAEQQRARAETAEAQVRELENERDDLRRKLQAERAKTWWQKLTGRGMATD